MAKELNKIFIFFNWRIIALQCCRYLCHTSRGISHCCSVSCVRLFATPWTSSHQASLSFTISWRLLKLMSIESMMPFNHLLPPFLLPSMFPSIKVFSNELALHIRWPKCWNLNFSTSPSNEYSGLIFFRIDRFDLFAVQGTGLISLQSKSLL